MKCPFCEHADTKVIDSRHTEEGHAIRRRRECEKCGKRFTTYEKIEEMVLVVIKKDGGREPFDRNKILSGIIKACEKRPVPVSEMESHRLHKEEGFFACGETQQKNSCKRPFRAITGSKE